MTDTQENYNIKDRGPASLLNTLYFGAEYFRKVYKLAEFLGKGQVAIDSAEVLFQLVFSKNRKYVSRSNLEEFLCMDTQKVAKAISFLKKLNLVISHKKGLLLTTKMPNNRVWSVEETFDYYNSLHSMNYEGAWDRIWELMSLFYTLKDWIGLTNIPSCSRRHFLACLCLVQPIDCCDKKAKEIMDSILNLDIFMIGEQYAFDNYRGSIEEQTKLKQEKARCLSIYHKARLLLFKHPDWLKKDTYPIYIPSEAVKAVKLTVKHFPISSKNNPTLMNTWNVFLYEYLVHQPTTGDYEFSPFSPFFGLPLYQRLEMLPNTIGTDSKEYNKGYLTQEQWVGIFNYENRNENEHHYLHGCSVIESKKKRSK